MIRAQRGQLDGAAANGVRGEGGRVTFEQRQCLHRLLVRVGVQCGPTDTRSGAIVRS